MAQMSYNSISFPYCQISQFNSRVLYDEVGGVDWYCTEFDIQVQATIHYYYLSLVIPSWNNAAPVSKNPAEIMSYIRSRLLKPRQQLSVQINGSELIPQYNSVLKNPVDADNGPKPQFCDIVQLTDTAFLISFRITARYWENVSSKAAPPVKSDASNTVLYNRWSESASIDFANFTTKTRQGKFRIRSDNLSAYTADQLRTQMAAVSIPQGFIRESGEYTIDPSGLIMEYRLVDKEQFRMPPSPAFRAEGDYKESTNNPGGNIRTMEARCRLWGDKANSPQAFLGYRALALCAEKIRSRVTLLFNGGQATNLFQIEASYISTSMFENSAEAYVRARVGMTVDRLQGLGGYGNFSASVPYADPVDYVPPTQVRGSAGILLQTAAYYDPNLGAKLAAGNMVDPADNPYVDQNSNDVQLNKGFQPGQEGVG